VTTNYYFPYQISLLSNVVGSNSVVSQSVSNGVTNFTTNNSTVILPSTNYIYIEPVGLTAYNDSVYLNGSFYGNVQNSYPNQTFNASGTLLQTQLAPQTYGATATNKEGAIPVQVATPVSISVSVQGVRVSDNITAFATVTNSLPYSQTAYTITNFNTTSFQ
jgi:hypothetical protein